MPFSVAGRLEGGEEFLRALQSLDKKLATKIARRAIAAACKPVVAAAKQNALAIKDTGLLSKSIGSRVRVYKSGVVVAYIGPRSGYRQVGTRKFKLYKRGEKRVRGVINPTNYAHLVEFGTAAHSYLFRSRFGSYRRVNHPGARPKPFLRPAWDTTKAQAKAILVAHLRAGLVEART